MRYADLGPYLVQASLYRHETIEGAKLTVYDVTNFWLHAPEIVDRECPKCGITKWRLEGGVEVNRINPWRLTHLTYECRNCGRERLDVWVTFWRTDDGVAHIEKAGQYPKLEVSIPAEFGRALGTRRALYIKGMTLRHNGYGIGSLTYFRRVIEETTDEMLDLLEGTMKETGADPAAIRLLEEAKASNQFENKVKVAGEVFPAYLRPGGVNPFGDLHVLVSIGLHGLTDEQCCEIVDAMDRSLKFVYTQLKTHAEDARAYRDAAINLSRKVAELKQPKREEA